MVIIATDDAVRAVVEYRVGNRLRRDRGQDVRKGLLELELNFDLNGVLITNLVNQHVAVPIQTKVVNPRRDKDTRLDWNSSRVEPRTE